MGCRQGALPMLLLALGDVLLEQGGEIVGLSEVLHALGVDIASVEQVSAALEEISRRDKARFSMRIASAGAFDIHQDITSEVLNCALPVRIPVLTEHFSSGRLFVRSKDGKSIPAAKTACLFKEALRWCAADYADLLPEFGDLLAMRAGENQAEAGDGRAA